MTTTRTPAWGSGGRTPNPFASGDGKTPAWNASSRTPNPYVADGGKTPAWNASSRTPNPYAGGDGGKTPAWNASSRTPNPYSEPSWGSGGWGGSASPARPADSSWSSWVSSSCVLVWKRAHEQSECTNASCCGDSWFLICTHPCCIYRRTYTGRHYE
jgi:hypothetical protein